MKERILIMFKCIKVNKKIKIQITTLLLAVAIMTSVIIGASYNNSASHINGSTNSVIVDANAVSTKAKMGTVKQALAIRANAGTNYKRIDGLKKGDIIYLTGTSKGNWVKIVYGTYCKTGWVYKKYVKIENIPIAIEVIKNNANVRANHNPTSEICEIQAKKGEQYKVLGMYGPWYKINFNKMQSWIYAGNVKKISNITVSTTNSTTVTSTTKKTTTTNATSITKQSIYPKYCRVYASSVTSKTAVNGSKNVATYKKGKELQIINESGKWIKVKDEKTGKAGWIQKSKVEETPYKIIVYKKDQITVVYDRKTNAVIKVFMCSTGKNNGTASGTYYIQRTKEEREKNYTWRLLQGNVYGQYGTTFSLAKGKNYLFHSIPYTKNGKRETMEIDGYKALLAGKADSAGCVRMCVEDAQWIFKNCNWGTTVIVSDKESGLKDSAKELPALKTGKNSKGKSYSGWDPTDPHKDNPYKS